MSCECQKTVANYVGKLVFVEKVRRPDDTSRTYSGYNNGEYFIIRQSPFTLYGVKLTSDVYTSHELKQFPLIGDEAYFVVSTGLLDASAKVSVQMLWRNACAVDRGEKLNWVANVYHDAKNTAMALAEALGINLEVPIPSMTGFNIPERLTLLEGRMKKVVESLGKLGDSARVA